MKLPSFQFYPGDWLKDPNLARASLRAKGALIQILCLAFNCDKRGYLKTGNEAWTIEEISMAMGGEFAENLQAIDELLTKKILKKDRKGAIFSSRMVQDEKLRKIRREAGFKGGNPILLKQKVNTSANQNTTPSSSSSSSSSIVVSKKEEKGATSDPLFEKFRRASPKVFSDEKLIIEIGKFKNKYPDEKSQSSGALINAWISKIPIQGEEPVITNGRFKNITGNGVN